MPGESKPGDSSVVGAGGEEISDGAGASGQTGTGSHSPKRRRRKRPLEVWKAVLLQPQVLRRLGIALGCLLVLWMVFEAGKSRGRSESASHVPPPPPALSRKTDEALIAAMATLRQGDPADALAQLRGLAEAEPRLASLQYAIALAALEAGEPSRLEKSIDESLRRGERVSDALALRAANYLIQNSNPGWIRFSNPRSLAVDLLHRAIAADPLNPSPRVELATSLRLDGKPAEAAVQLQAAKALMLPVDPAQTVPVSLALMAVESLQHDELPLLDFSNRRPETLAVNACVAARNGNLELAAWFLHQLREQTPKNLFLYLVQDPALRPYTNTPELRGVD